MKECNHCSTENPNKALYCRRCGSSRLGKLKKVQTHVPNRKQRNTAIACFMVIATLTMGSCYMIMNSDDPSDRQEFFFWCLLSVAMALTLLAKAVYEHKHRSS